MSDLEDDGVASTIVLPDPLEGVDSETADPIQKYMIKTADSTAEIIILIAEGTSIIAKLPKLTTGTGRKTEIIQKYPLLHSALTRHIRDLQNKRLVLDTFG